MHPQEHGAKLATALELTSEGLRQGQCLGKGSMAQLDPRMLSTRLRVTDTGCLKGSGAADSGLPGTTQA